METRNHSRVVSMVAVALLAAAAVAATPPTVRGSFDVGGVEAGLRQGRATSVALDEKTSGYAVLLSARKAEGDLGPWRIGDPEERGSFIFLIVEKSGAVWIAEIAHAAAKTRRFGVVTEVQVKDFHAQSGRVSGKLTTGGEQIFTEDHYRIDLEFDLPLEP